MVIHVTINTAEPLTGSASCCEREPVPFVGWLQLLRAVAELVGTPGCTADQDQSDTSAGDSSVGNSSAGEIGAAQACGEPATVRIVGPLAADLSVIEPPVRESQVCESQTREPQVAGAQQAPVGEGHPV